VKKNRPAKRIYVCRTAAATFRLGVRLGRTLREGSRVLLTGPLGAGKTLFTRGIARGMDVHGADGVASPTFVLMCRHEGKRGHPALVHMDLYRVDSRADWEGAGLGEALADERAVCVIEWAEKIPVPVPGAIRIAFRVMRDGSRRISVALPPREEA
jgi:tRNA threonylcarbamoyladenosine biosynthesis protein TsaE